MAIQNPRYAGGTYPPNVATGQVPNTNVGFRPFAPNPYANVNAPNVNASPYNAGGQQPPQQQQSAIGQSSQAAPQGMTDQGGWDGPEGPGREATQHGSQGIGGSTLGGAAQAGGYSVGTSNPAEALGGALSVVGSAFGLPPGIGSAISGFGDTVSSFGAPSTYGHTGTIDPATGAVFGTQSIPGQSFGPFGGGNVAQGYNPVTGQAMSVFSGIPSASYLGGRIADSFAPGQQQAFHNPYAPSALAQNTNNMHLSALDRAQLGYLDPATEDIHAQFGFTPASASGYNISGGLTGQVGAGVGDVASSDTGNVGFVNEAGQIETPTGTVVGLHGPQGYVSLLEDPTTNLSNLHGYQQDVSAHHDTNVSEGGGDTETGWGGGGHSGEQGFGTDFGSTGGVGSANPADQGYGRPEDAFGSDDDGGDDGGNGGK